MLIDTDANPITRCYYCDAPLAPQFDFSCAICTRETCDNDSRACQVDFGCDVVTCFACADTHVEEFHGAIAWESIQ